MTIDAKETPPMTQEELVKVALGVNELVARTRALARNTRHDVLARIDPSKWAYRFSRDMVRSVDVQKVAKLYLNLIAG